MTLKLALSSVVKGATSWVALTVTSVALSVVLTLNIALVLAGAAAQGEAQQAYVAMGSVALGFSLLTGLASFISVVGICVRLQRRDVALWQIVGLLPRKAFLILLVEILLVSAGAAAVGVVLSILVWPAYADFVGGSGLPNSSVLHSSIPMPALILGVATTSAVSVFAGLYSSRNVVRGNLVEGVRIFSTFEVKGSSIMLRVVTLVVGIAMLVGVGAIYRAISLGAEITDAQKLGDFLTVYPGMGLLLCLVFAVNARPIIRLSVALSKSVPGGGLPKFLASSEAAARPRLTQALVIPISMAAAAVGVMIGWIDKLKATLIAETGSASSVSAPPEQLALLLGGPVLAACVAAAAIVFATMANRREDNALLIVSGATSGTVYAKTVVEVLIYAAIELVCAYLIVAVNEVAMTVALSSGPIPSTSLSWPGLETSCVIAFGTVLTLVMLLIITSSGLRKQSVIVVGGK